MRLNCNGYRLKRIGIKTPHNKIKTEWRRRLYQTLQTEDVQPSSVKNPQTLLE
jgi:hypothetical protein